MSSSDREQVSGEAEVVDLSKIKDTLAEIEQLRLVPADQFPGHKAIALANLEGWLGGRVPALVAEIESLRASRQERPEEPEERSVADLARIARASRDAAALATGRVGDGWDPAEPLPVDREQPEGEGA